MVSDKEQQKYRLLRFMQQNPFRAWYAKDFQNGPRFIGYEAGPRLCDLCDDGLVLRVGRVGRFVLYSLTEAGMATAFDDNGAIILPEMAGADAQPVNQ